MLVALGPVVIRCPTLAAGASLMLLIIVPDPSYWLCTYVPVTLALHTPRRSPVVRECSDGGVAEALLVVCGEVGDVFAFDESADRFWAFDVEYFYGCGFAY